MIKSVYSLKESGNAYSLSWTTNFGMTYTFQIQ